MFIVSKTKSQTITWPVAVEIAADGGKIVKHSFTGTFKKLSDDERKELFPEAVETPKVDPEEVGGETQATVPEVDWKEESVDNILKVMTGWSQIVDESKTPLDFNRENLLALARSAHGISILRGINTALTEIRTDARVKN